MSMNIGGHELQDMKNTFPKVGNRSYWDIRRQVSTLTPDGLPAVSWATIDSRQIDVQPVQWSQRESANRMEIELGGIKYVPTFYAWLPREADITATDTITEDSGANAFLVLRTYDYSDHTEADLVEEVNP